MMWILWSVLLCFYKLLTYVGKYIFLNWLRVYFKWILESREPGTSNTYITYKYMLSHCGADTVVKEPMKVRTLQ